MVLGWIYRYRHEKSLPPLRRWRESCTVRVGKSARSNNTYLSLHINNLYTTRADYYRQPFCTYCPGRGVHLRLSCFHWHCRSVCSFWGFILVSMQIIVKEKITFFACLRISIVRTPKTTSRDVTSQWCYVFLQFLVYVFPWYSSNRYPLWFGRMY
jgi:hypothetical protein